MTLVRFRYLQEQGIFNDLTVNEPSSSADTTEIRDIVLSSLLLSLAARYPTLAWRRPQHAIPARSSKAGKGAVAHGFVSFRRPTRAWAAPTS